MPVMNAKDVQAKRTSFFLFQAGSTIVVSVHHCAFAAFFFYCVVRKRGRKRIKKNPLKSSFFSDFLLLFSYHKYCYFLISHKWYLTLWPLGFFLYWALSVLIFSCDLGTGPERHWECPTTISMPEQRVDWELKERERESLDVWNGEGEKEFVRIRCFVHISHCLTTLAHSVRTTGFKRRLFLFSNEVVWVSFSEPRGEHAV